jgi:hypothetical protein
VVVRTARTFKKGRQKEQEDSFCPERDADADRGQEAGKRSRREEAVRQLASKVGIKSIVVSATIADLAPQDDCREEGAGRVGANDHPVPAQDAVDDP